MIQSIDNFISIKDLGPIDFEFTSVQNNYRLGTINPEILFR
jgi:hypothetical protein